MAARNAFEIADVWKPRFSLNSTDKFATFGSCFAAHVGAALRSRGLEWLDAEPPPTGLSEEDIRRFGYRISSARTGYIYTASLLEQWVRWACGIWQPPDEEIWTENGRLLDPFRQRIEPAGFASEEELRASRAHTLNCLRACIRQADHFVFTLGLTERWTSRKYGHEYPMCPGTVNGTFDGSAHVYSKTSVLEVIEKLRSAIGLMRQLNTDLKIILTVSPVSLAATSSGQHVLVASTESKAILRAAVGELTTLPYVDYFPSFELISSPVLRGVFFEPDQRRISPAGVEFAMRHFFRGIAYPSDSASMEDRDAVLESDGGRSDCDEALLDAFLEQ